MPDTPTPHATLAERLKGYSVPTAIVTIAAALIFFLSGQWTSWGSDRADQTTDDAYLRADLTPLSTKAAGLVASVEVQDYQSVKAGDLLVRLRDDDFRAQVEQAEAAVAAGESALANNRRQKELQDARITQAAAGIQAAEADIAASEAGIAAANSSTANAKSGLAAVQADVQRTLQERRRQEALAATESTTRQRLEQAIADEQRFQAQLASRESDIAAAGALLASRQADAQRARARVASTQAELEAQRRQRAVLDSTELSLRADLNAKRAMLSLAQTNIAYTKILAPEDGIVGERKVRAGQLVSPGTQVLSLVQKQTWVLANFKETQLRHMRIGDPAEIRIDAYPGVVLQGKVGQIAPASGSQFALLPPDNATGNFTKVTQRVPVKILLDEKQTVREILRPGLSVIATVKTSGRASN
ncbi:MAG: HlyD family secretion protein [Paludibaculum sp.]